MKNNYSIQNDKVYIELNRGLTGIISLSDFKKANEFNNTWYASYVKSTNSYRIIGSTYGNGERKTIKLHRWILGIDNPKIKIDHRNHNTLDNTRENLRVCTNQENQFNKSTHNPNKSSKHKGVYWNKNAGKWKASIDYSKKRMHLGYFTSEDEAGESYNKKAIELFGEFALLNKIS